MLHVAFELSRNRSNGLRVHTRLLMVLLWAGVEAGG